MWCSSKPLQRFAPTLNLKSPPPIPPDFMNLAISSPTSTPVGRRSIPRLLAPLEHLAKNSKHLLRNTTDSFLVQGESYALPRYIFRGPGTNIEPLRLAIFAGIHGDEPETALGLIQFLEELDRHPALAEGYEIFTYPLCNPTGYEDQTRASRRGFDLNREFWKNSNEVEIHILEQELQSLPFHGIVSLHSDDTSNGMYGFVRGPDISEELLKPALHIADKILPRNPGAIIDGFEADQGIIRQGYTNILSAPADIRPRPFEIVLETPAQAPVYLQVAAFRAALQTILDEYRALISIAPGL